MRARYLLLALPLIACSAVALARAQAPTTLHTRGILQTDTAAVTAQLMQADRDFAAATAKERLAGWRRFWANDASSWEGSKGFIQGADTLAVLHTQLFSDSALSLLWTPTAATAWSSDLGATTGTYQRVEKYPDGTIVERSHGTYLTIWRKTPAGWRVILDGGYPEP